MATFTNPARFAEHVAGYSQKIERASPAATKAAAEVVAIALRQAGSKYKIKGRRGGKFALGAKIEGPYGYGGNWIAYVKADPAGFWGMVEKGSKPHWIVPAGITKGRRQRSSTRARGKQALFGTGYAHPIGQPVFHPGHGAIGHPWEIGLLKASVTAPKVFERALVSAVF